MTSWGCARTTASACSGVRPASTSVPGRSGEETPSPRIRRRAASRPGLATPESPGTFARAVCRRRRREREGRRARGAGEEGGVDVPTGPREAARVDARTVRRRRTRATGDAREARQKHLGRGERRRGLDAPPHCASERASGVYPLRRAASMWSSRFLSWKTSGVNVVGKRDARRGPVVRARAADSRPRAATSRRRRKRRGRDRRCLPGISTRWGRPGRGAGGGDSSRASPSPTGTVAAMRRDEGS